MTLQPFGTAIMSMIFLNSIIAPLQILGGALIIAGLLITAMVKPKDTAATSKPAFSASGDVSKTSSTVTPEGIEGGDERGATVELREIHEDSVTPEDMENDAPRHVDEEAAMTNKPVREDDDHELDDHDEAEQKGDAKLLPT